LSLTPPYTYTDPPLSQTASLLNGIGAGWVGDETELRLSLRDPTYWLERPVDGAVYLGTGGLEGNATLAGKRKPRLRGGTAGSPVREISPVLVDPVLGIYQVSDATGAIVNLYERGLGGSITFGGTVADITTTVPAAGTYRVESSSRGLFLRLGTFPPAGVITVDAWGAFPSGSTPSTAAEVALQLLLQDLAVPSAFVDNSSFTSLASTNPWTAGLWLGADEQIDGVAVVGTLLRSSAARLIPRRDGRLAAIRLGPIAAGTSPVATFNTAQIIECSARVLSPPMAPPPYRVRVAWGRNYTVQTSALAPTLSGTRIQELAESWRLATGANAAVSASWRRPSDPPLVETSLTNGTHAQSLADGLAALWCIPEGRRLYDVSIPFTLSLAREIGDVISIQYPGPLNSGALGRIVGEQLRVADNIATLQVLV
jgi:hypothetical protein